MQKGVASGGACLHARVELMHELEELIDDGLEEAPVRAQEARVLAHNVHDVARDDGLVVLAIRDFAQIEQVPDDGNQELVLLVLVH